MKPNILIALIILLLAGCAVAPQPLPKASSIEDYCSGVGDFVYSLSERVGDYNRNNLTPINKDIVKSSLNAEIQRTVEALPNKEHKKMMDMVDFVFNNLSLSPDQTARSAYATCVTQRNNNTWF